MGVLDDAIREHLDLKRLHGADPSDVERAEREALGPVRRGPEEAPALEGTEEPGDADHQGPEWEGAGEAEVDLPAEGVSDTAPEPRPLEPAAASPEHLDVAPEGAPAPEHNPFDDDGGGGGGGGGETTEYDVADALEKDPKEGEDVLEETPDFLQETPEHDRLWFEQRPPRDFDFDG